MNKPNFYVASDYAGLDFKGGSFYYGYEKSMCLECGNMNNGEFCDEHEDADRSWCFVAAIRGVSPITIPFHKMGTKDMFDVVDNLLTGIGWVLAKYPLKEGEG